MYRSFWYIDPDLLYEHEPTEYHKKSDADLLTTTCFVSLAVDSCLSLFHVIFSTDASDDISASVPWLHHSVQALKNQQNTHKFFFFSLPIFA